MSGDRPPKAYLPEVVRSSANNNVHPRERALVGGYQGLMLVSCICDGSIGEYVANTIKGDENKVRERC